MRAEIIAIGSELLGPAKVDTNSLFLTERLNELGIAVTGKTVVGDDRHHLESAIRGALERADLVVTTGGLGPTRDDITREAASAVTGRKLVLNTDVLKFLEDRYRDRGTAFLDNNRSQALVLDGAIPIPNGPGAAPGAYLELENSILVMLPGVPREMRYMVDTYLVEKIRSIFQLESRHVLSINLCGVPESVVDHGLSGIDFASMGLAYTILANMRRVQITLSGLDREAVDRCGTRVRCTFPRAWYGDGDVHIEEVMLQRLRQQGKTMAVAESCTGGLLGKLLTDTPGSSASFVGGVIAYHNRVKQDVLQVSEDLIRTYGAVSGQVAASMAIQVRRLLKSDYGVSITGIAGPDAEGEKSVGLVYLAVSDGSRTRVREHRFKGTREMIRIQSATRSVDLLRRTFLPFEAEGPA